jgi:hypothetical protein
VQVVKTAKQTSAESITYVDATKGIIATEGLGGLFGRGLKTRLVVNGLQGALFSVLWKYFETHLIAGTPLS